MNRHLGTAIAPMTSQTRDYPSRIAGKFPGKTGQVVLDQIRTVDKTRRVKRLGRIGSSEQRQVLDRLAEMFAE